MNKKEFKEYVKQFNKKPGEYSVEEIYEIGVTHKTLQKSDKDWNNLSKVLGISKSGETLRKWILNRQLADGSLPKNKQLLSGRTIADVTTNEIRDNLDKQLEDLYIQQTKTKDTWNAYRKDLRNEARVQALKDSIEESIPLLFELPEFKFCPNKKQQLNSEAILMLSDLHLGVDCDNFYNKYNIDIATKRLAKLADDTIKYCKQNNVKKLCCINLGDMIAGIIHLTARINETFDVIKQVTSASELLANLLVRLQQAAPEVTYRSVVDNHARVTPNKEEHIEVENFNRLIDWYLEARLKGTNIKFMHDNLDIGLGKIVLDNGKIVLFAHGHEDRLSTVVQDYIGATHEWVDYVLLGHFHNSKMKQFQGAKVFVNGSIVGTEEYALSKRLFSNPEQSLLVFDNDNVINYIINLKD